MIFLVVAVARATLHATAPGEAAAHSQVSIYLCLSCLDWLLSALVSCVAVTELKISLSRFSPLFFGIHIFVMFCSRHYAAKLDGCGLELENQVRKAYRMLVSRLVNSLGSSPKGLTE